jgi:NADP-dependent aldehyde dehydrogenase
MLTDGIAEKFVEGIRAVGDVDGVDTLTVSSGAGDPALFAVNADTFLAHHKVLGAEVFGPTTLLVRYSDETELLRALEVVEGSLTATLHAEEGDDVTEVLDALVDRSGRVLFAGWPTGVAVLWAQQHGGPWPATTTQHTSVGATATRRFQRPVAFQDAPDHLLPAALREDNPLKVPRRVDSVVE